LISRCLRPGDYRHGDAQNVQRSTGRRTAKNRKNIPVLLCTGHSGIVDEKKSKDINIKGFSIIPLDKRRMARAVRAALDKSGDG
jgi:DNA-binding NtrC family response regulator